VAYLANNYFVTGGAVIVQSADGTNWTRHATIQSSQLVNDITFGNGRYVAVGQELNFFYGNLGFTMESGNGMDWTQDAASFNSGGLESVCFDNGHFVAVGSPPFKPLLSPEPSSVWTSTDGDHWVGQSSILDDLKDVASDGRTFVAVGRGGAIWQSAPYLQLGQAQPMLTDVRTLGDRTLRLTIASGIARDAAVESSSDLRAWTEFKRIALRSGLNETTVAFTNSTRFFRIK
jgi:hypothetical protein